MKLCQCRSCGKEFDEPLPTMISWMEDDSLIPVTTEVCPYCFSPDFDMMFPDEDTLETIYLTQLLEKDKELLFELMYQYEQAGLIKVTEDGIINLLDEGKEGENERDEQER